jgi:hypothetical protein
VLPDLVSDHVALFALSYDSVETLAAFAEKHGITYPLLSDEGSRVIRELGLLNEHLAEQQAQYGVQTRDEQLGVAYPGIFVLDENGVVVQKRFQQSYRDREGGVGLIEDALGVAAASHGSGAEAQGPEFRARAYLDSPTYHYFERLRLTVELTVEPPYHVYVAPVPDGYVPLSVIIEPIEGLEVGEMRWPEPRRLKIGLNEEFWVLDDTIRGSMPLVFAAPAGAGDHELRVAVSFQTCSDDDCLMPTTLHFTLPVRETDMVDRPIRR